MFNVKGQGVVAPVLLPPEVLYIMSITTVSSANLTMVVEFHTVISVQLLHQGAQDTTMGRLQFEGFS